MQRKVHMCRRSFLIINANSSVPVVRRAVIPFSGWFADMPQICYGECRHGGKVTVHVISLQKTELKFVHF
jgi:hypothetical protein